MDSRDEGYDPYNSARRADIRFANKVRANVNYGKFLLRKVEVPKELQPVLTVHMPFSEMMTEETRSALFAVGLYLRARLRLRNLTKPAPRA